METIFDLSGLLVMPFWLLMIFSPRWRWARRIMASPLACVAPALLYLARQAQEFVRHIARRQPLVFWTGVAHLALFALFLALMPLDPRTILGIDPWIKPSKFAISIATYLLTIVIFVDHLALSRRAHRVVSWSLALAMIIEMTLISMQSARGTTSHFNRTTAFDYAVFAVMGATITYAAGVAGYVLFKYFQSAPALPPAYLWGIRLGLFIFLLANAEGLFMATRPGHAVGVADGGAGLPYTNWSTEAGDLRTAHFIGMHALQAVPLAGLALSWLGASGRLRRPEAWVGAFGAAYGAVALLLFFQALAGQPLLRL
jgi:hypothetical protein